MHVKDLLRLAVDVALGAPAASARGKGLPAELTNQYWLAAKGCQDLWFQQMKRYRDRFPQGDPQAARAAWMQLRGVLEEILAGEVLVRTWAAAVAWWEEGGPAEAEPVVRSVVLGHTEARLRATMLLLHAPGVPARDAAELNQLGNRAARWCDMLIGRLMLHGAKDHWACNPGRAAEYAQDFSTGPADTPLAAVRKLLRASLQRAFWPLLRCPAAAPRLIEGIFYSISPALPAPALDRSPHLDFRACWEHRLQTVSDYTQGLIDDLLALDRGPTPAEKNSDV